MRNLALLLLIASGCITDPGLFIDKTGSGNGRVVSEPAGIDCGEQCGALTTGPVTLTATPYSWAVFTGWSGGGCSGTDPCTVDITTETTVEALFDVGPTILTVEPSPHGRVTATGGIDCGDVCSAELTPGTQVRATAIPDDGYAFVQWTAGFKQPVWSFPVDESTTLKATFESTSRLFVGFGGIGTGTVSSYPPGINCPSGRCDARFDPGTVVTLTATVLVGQSVTWDGCMAHAMLPNVCTVVVQGAPYVTAMFN